MRKTQSVVSLDAIDRTRKKQDGIIGRFFKTRHYGGKKIGKTDPFGHYLFAGKQRSGKTVSAIWYKELLEKKYKKKHFKIKNYSNMGWGIPVNRSTFHAILEQIEYEEGTIHIFVIDEIQSWFPKDTKNQELLRQIDDLTGDFSQLGKRHIYVLSTAQVYGRLNKNLREQCLYMVDCRRSLLTNRCVNDFIEGDDIVCDELGRWSGVPKFIMVHGLPKMYFDTHKLIKNN